MIWEVDKELGNPRFLRLVRVAPGRFGEALAFLGGMKSVRAPLLFILPGLVRQILASRVAAPFEDLVLRTPSLRSCMNNEIYAIFANVYVKFIRVLERFAVTSTQ